ncbi:hypothetical protein ADUPG1_009448, partial [Aduncisulcus paluster]
MDMARSKQTARKAEAERKKL